MADKPEPAKPEYEPPDLPKFVVRDLLERADREKEAGKAIQKLNAKLSGGSQSPGK